MITDLKNTRILISNDDGVESEGILLLEKIARTLSDDVWICAPATEQSGAGHSLTLHEPLRLRKVAERRFAVAGTPTDAVFMGVMEVLKDKKPGLVLSGINRGSNLAEDVTYSGTVSAAMEAALLDIPAIALSNTIANGVINWETPERFAGDIIRALVGLEWPSGTLMSVNFPAIPAAQVKGVRSCAHGRRILTDNLDRRTDPHGRPYFWIGGPRTEAFGDQRDTDIAQITQGYITVTPLNLDLTEYKLLAQMCDVKALNS